MPREPRKHTTHEEAEETQRTILRTAQQLFMEYGYRAVTTRQLADACGLTQPALYHYFADKQELYVAMVKDEVAKMKAALERIAHRNEEVPERLKLVVLYLLTHTQHDLSLMLHDMRYELTQEAQSVLSELFHSGVVATIATIFEDGIQTGLLHGPQQGGVDAITATYLLMSMLSRFLTRSQRGAQAEPTISGTELANRLVQILLYGLSSSANGQRP